MKIAAAVGTLCLVTPLIFLPVSPASALDASTSSCVTCHTDVKGLIRLGWEVEKVRGKARVSAENEGEG